MNSNNIYFNGEQAHEAINFTFTMNESLRSYFDDVLKIDKSFDAIEAPYDKVVAKLDPRFSNIANEINTNLSSVHNDFIDKMQFIENSIMSYSNGGIGGDFGGAYSNNPNGRPLSPSNSNPSLGNGEQLQQDSDSPMFSSDQKSTSASSNGADMGSLAGGLVSGMGNNFIKGAGSSLGAGAVIAAASFAIGGNEYYDKNGRDSVAE